MQIKVSDYCKGADFYSRVLGWAHDESASCPPANQTETHYGIGFRLPSDQQIDLGAFGTPNPYKLVEGFSFLTDDAPALLEYLTARGVETNYAGRTGKMIGTHDPDGHPIFFFQLPPNLKHKNISVQLGPGQRIIHIGFIVYNRAAMEHFYKDILGFRPYWHGGMKDDETSWVSLQVPDGTDWLEFMLHDPTGKDKHFLGVMNHIALGVTDIHATQEQLRKNGAPLTEEPKIGRDGKWQLNLYDPDETRIEFMEFTPVQKPCCSEFTAPHPKP